MSNLKDNNVRLVLDLGEPPYPGKENSPFEILFSLSAASGSRVSIDKRVLPETSNMLELMDRLEEKWSKGDFSVSYMILWIFSETGLFYSHCQKLGMDPGKYLYDILRRAKELNSRYGEWRITLHARGELDSCFIDFPAKWKDIDECYANWEKFNLSDLHFIRYKKYGYQPCYGNLPDNYPIKDLFNFLAKYGFEMKDFPMDVCCNRGFDIHHNLTKIC